jgi:hypothetical protein
MEATRGVVLLLSQVHACNLLIVMKLSDKVPFLRHIEWVFLGGAFGLWRNYGRHIVIVVMMVINNKV